MFKQNKNYRLVTDMKVRNKYVRRKEHARKKNHWLNQWKIRGYFIQWTACLEISQKPTIN